jgi:AraC-like DNA-binding protein
VNIISIIALAGAAQGIFLTLTLLAWRKGNRRANTILAVTFAIMSLAMWNTYLNTSGLYRTWTFSIRVYDALRLLTGPLIYLYVREMVVRPVVWRDWLHVLPAVVNVVVLIPFFLSSDAEKIRFMEQTLEGASQDYIIFAALRPWVALVYFALSLRLLREYSRRIRERFASLEVVSLQWLWNIVLGLSAMALLIAVASLWTFGGNVRPNQINQGMAIFAVLWLYGLAYFALQKTMVYSSELRQLLAEPIEFPASMPLPLQAPTDAAKHSSSAAEGAGQKASAAGDELYIDRVVTSNDRLLPRALRFSDESSVHAMMAKQPPDPQLAEQDTRLLTRFMEEQKPYLDSQLTLQKLAMLSDIPAYRISDILNKHLGINFFDFINRYRVEEWKRQIADAPTSRTIQEIAFQVGFNSKSSFNTAFKKHSGQTPSEYRREHRTEYPAEYRTTSRVA